MEKGEYNAPSTAHVSGASAISARKKRVKQTDVERIMRVEP